MNAGRSHFDVSPISEQTAEKPFRNRATTNVTGADKEDAFHDSSGSRERVVNVELNVSKSIWRLSRSVRVGQLGARQKFAPHSRYLALLDAVNCRYDWLVRARCSLLSAFGNRIAIG
jgi:hypothetical protein